MTTQLTEVKQQALLKKQKATKNNQATEKL